MKTVIAFVLLLLAAAPVHAATYSFITDYYGYSWETDGNGNPPGVPLAAGNKWNTVGVVNSVFTPLTADLVHNELTFTILNLVQTGPAVVTGAGVDARRGPWTQYQITYADGATMDLYLDSSFDANWGTDPVNGTSPASFLNGSLYLTATTKNMVFLLTVYTNSGDEIGTFETDLTFTGGSNVNQLGGAGKAGYSFAGITRRPEAAIPQGYKERLDGQQFTSPVAPTTWGAIKRLYR